MKIPTKYVRTDDATKAIRGIVCSATLWPNLQPIQVAPTRVKEWVRCASGKVCYQNDQNNDQNYQIIKMMIMSIPLPARACAALVAP